MTQGNQKERCSKPEQTGAAVAAKDKHDTANIESTVSIADYNKSHNRHQHEDKQEKTLVDIVVEDKHDNVNIGSTANISYGNKNDNPSQLPSTSDSSAPLASSMENGDAKVVKASGNEEAANISGSAVLVEECEASPSVENFNSQQDGDEKSKMDGTDELGLGDDDKRHSCSPAMSETTNQHEDTKSPIDANAAATAEESVETKTKELEAKIKHLQEQLTFWNNIRTNSENSSNKYKKLEKKLIKASNQLERLMGIDSDTESDSDDE